MDLKKQDFLKYLADARSHYTVYHNHKEASAWAGVGLYGILVTQVMVARGDVLREHGVVVAASVLVAALMGVMLVYLRTQFRLRREAANYTAALLYLSASWVARDLSDLGDLTPEVTGDAGHHSPQILPKLVLSKSDGNGSSGSWRPSAS